MAASTQDLVKGLDFTGLTSATASQFNQLVDAGAPATDKGIILTTVDTDIDVPDVPDAATTTKWQRYIWRRLPYPSVVDLTPTFYTWVTTADATGATKRWRPLPSLAITTALQNQVKAFDIIIKSPTVDPRYFGADPTGALNSVVAFRQALYYAASIGGIVKVQPGTYKILRDNTYGSDESKPFGYGGDRTNRERVTVYIPIPDKGVLTAEGNAILKLGTMTPENNPGDQSAYMISSRGFVDTIVEGITIDGDYFNQPKIIRENPSLLYYFTGPPMDGIGAGLRGIVRNCLIKGLGGNKPLEISGVTITAGYPQTFLVNEREYYGIVASTDCRIENNTVRDSWGGGMIMSGSRNKIIGNCFEDLAHQGIGIFFPYLASTVDCAVGYSAFNIDYWMNSPQDTYKGVKIGSYASIPSGCFLNGAGATPVTDAQLAALSGNPDKTHYTSNDYDKSAYNYWSLCNEIRNNTISRVGQGAIHIERGLNTIVRNNKIIQGIPRLRAPSGAVLNNLTLNSVLSAPSQLGIYSTHISMDTVVEDNDFILSDPVVTLKDGTTTRYAAFNMIGYSEALNNVYFSAGTAQPCINELTLGSNRIAGRFTGFDKTLLQNLANGINGVTLLSGIPQILGDGFSGGNPIIIFPNAMTEINFTSGGSDDVTVIENAETQMLPLGSFKFINTQGVDSYEKDLIYCGVNPAIGYLAYAASNTPHVWGTMRTNFRLIPLRIDTLYRLFYSAALGSKVNSVFKPLMEGTILFQYTGGSIVKFDHEIMKLDFNGGSIEVMPFYDQIRPYNKCRPSGRLLDVKYRGGLAFYATAYDPTILSYQDGYVPYLDNNVFVTFSGKLEELGS